MRIRNILHKGLKRFVESGDSSALPPNSVPKLQRMISFLQAMHDESELKSVQVWKAHQLKGSRKGVWALHVTANWRLTFGIYGKEIEIIDLDYEDYH